MIKKILDKYKKLRNTVSTKVKWKTRSAKEKATIVLTSAILGIMLFIVLAAYSPGFALFLMFSAMFAIIIFMFWKMLEDTFQ